MVETTAVWMAASMVETMDETWVVILAVTRVEMSAGERAVMTAAITAVSMDETTAEWTAASMDASTAATTDKTWVGTGAATRAVMRAAMSA